MSIQIRDTISPELARLARKLSDKKPVLEAMGLQIVSLTERAFFEPSLRPSSWPARKGTHLEERTTKTGKKSMRVVSSKSGKEEHGLLLKSTTLAKSIRITKLNNDSVTVGSDRKYAAVHQFGSSKKKGRGGGIPARPFFPFRKTGELTPVAKQRIEATVLKAIKKMLPA